MRYELDLRERTVRVEEELAHQRELMIEEGFKCMDERFEQVDKRFDQVVKRMDRFMFWSLGLTVSATALVVNVLK